MLPDIRCVLTTIALLSLAVHGGSAYGRDKSDGDQSDRVQSGRVQSDKARSDKARSGKLQSNKALRSDNVLPPFGHTLFCLQYPLECQRTPSRKDFRVTQERLDELSDVNNSVNQEIQPVARQSDTTDQWSIDPPSGECGDYAVTKRHVLLQTGWPAERLLLAEVVLATGQHHLVLLVRTTTTAWVLDNLRSEVPEVSQVRDNYIWIRIETPENPKSWTRPFRVLDRDAGGVAAVFPRDRGRAAGPRPLTNASLTGAKQGTPSYLLQARTAFSRQNGG